MRKIIIVLFIFFLLLTGCEFRYDVPAYTGPRPERVFIESESIFSIDGELYLETRHYLPVTIYNPNNYTIPILCDGVEYSIVPHQSLVIHPTQTGNQLGGQA